MYTLKFNRNQNRLGHGTPIFVKKTPKTAFLGVGGNVPTKTDFDMESIKRNVQRLEPPFLGLGPGFGHFSRFSRAMRSIGVV